MKRPKKKMSSLKQVYYRNFVFLVVVPLLVVFMGMMTILKYRLRQAFLENIDTYQEGLRDTLKAGALPLPSGTTT